MKSWKMEERRGRETSAPATFVLFWISFLIGGSPSDQWGGPVAQSTKRFGWSTISSSLAQRQESGRKRETKKNEVPSWPQLQLFKFVVPHWISNKKRGEGFPLRIVTTFYESDSSLNETKWVPFFVFFSIENEENWDSFRKRRVQGPTAFHLVLFGSFTWTLRGFTMKAVIYLRATNEAGHSPH